MTIAGSIPKKTNPLKMVTKRSGESQSFSPDEIPAHITRRCLLFMLTIFLKHFILYHAVGRKYRHFVKLCPLPSPKNKKNENNSYSPQPCSFLPE